MQYFSQTGTGINETTRQLTAPPNSGNFSTIVGSGEIVFQETKDSFSTKAGVLINGDGMNEELSPEEENRFYRKVLKTSLI